MDFGAAMELRNKAVERINEIQINRVNSIQSLWGCYTRRFFFVV